MFLKKRSCTQSKEQNMNSNLLYPVYAMLFLVTVPAITLTPVKSYGLNNQDSTSGDTVTVYNFKQNDTSLQEFGNNCNVYLNEDNYNFGRDLKQRKKLGYAGMKKPDISMVVGFSIALGPDTVMDKGQNRLRFDTASADTMNGPISGFAAYRDCKTQNMLNTFQ